jgi:hypothetical protein
MSAGRVVDGGSDAPVEAHAERGSRGAVVVGASRSMGAAIIN